MSLLGIAGSVSFELDVLVDGGGFITFGGFLDGTKANRFSLNGFNVNRFRGCLRGGGSIFGIFGSGSPLNDKISSILSNACEHAKSPSSDIASSFPFSSIFCEDNEGWTFTDAFLLSESVLNKKKLT